MTWSYAPGARSAGHHALGAREDVNQAVHSWGGVVLHDIINNKFAHKAIEKGADGLIAVAAGAGGHAGVKSPFALIQEIRQWFDGPLALSGSIASGGAILAAQAMGADLPISVPPSLPPTKHVPLKRTNKPSWTATRTMWCIQPVTGVHGNYLAPSIRAAAHRTLTTCRCRTPAP